MLVADAIISSRLLLVALYIPTTSMSTRTGIPVVARNYRPFFFNFVRVRLTTSTSVHYSYSYQRGGDPTRITSAGRRPPPFVQAGVQKYGPDRVLESRNVSSRTSSVVMTVRRYVGTSFVLGGCSSRPAGVLPRRAAGVLC